MTFSMASPGASLLSERRKSNRAGGPESNGAGGAGPNGAGGAGPNGAGGADALRGATQGSPPRAVARPRPRTAERTQLVMPEFESDPIDSKSAGGGAAAGPP